MREHTDTACRGDHVHRDLEGSVDLLDVVLAARRQRTGERGVHVRNVTGIDQRAAQVRSSGCRSGRGQHRVGIDGQTVRRHLLGDGTQSRDPLAAQPRALGCEHLVRGVEQIRQ